MVTEAIVLLHCPVADKTKFRKRNCVWDFVGWQKILWDTWCETLRETTVLDDSGEYVYKVNERLIQLKCRS
jgi:hypothetical protein